MDHLPALAIDGALFDGHGVIELTLCEASGDVHGCRFEYTEFDGYLAFAICLCRRVRGAALARKSDHAGGAEERTMSAKEEKGAGASKPRMSRAKSGAISHKKSFAPSPSSRITCSNFRQ